MSIDVSTGAGNRASDSSRRTGDPKEVAIRLESVTKCYRGPSGIISALSNVSLVVERGSTVAITGASGCGKSTLLGLIAGLEVPDLGRVMVGEHEVSRLPDRRRAQLRRTQFGLVFQSDNLLPFLTAVENVAQQFALRRSRSLKTFLTTLPSRRTPLTLERSYDLLAAVGLESHADQLPDQLSGGQRQRVAVVRAMTSFFTMNLTDAPSLDPAQPTTSFRQRPSPLPPQILLADEPTGSLDGAASSSLVEFLLVTRRAVGATLVVVTHDPAVAERMDRIVRLENGELTFDTPTAAATS
jgi:putative ABC transport system ATP-binding protein